MPNLATLRQQVQHALQPRFASALEPCTRAKFPALPCGVSSLDDLFQGGLPVGAVTELIGDHCSGRTTAAMAYMAAVARMGSVCAWVDVQDSVDPESAAACGIDLQRLLWVRCGTESTDGGQPQPACPGTAANLHAIHASPPGSVGGGVHPRAEGRHMEHAVQALLQTQHDRHPRKHRSAGTTVGTPGAPNRPLSGRSPDREEQPNSDRLPPRRGKNLALVPRCAGPLPGQPSAPRLGALPRLKGHGDSLWTALDQALRATDLLLQNGGFRAVVLDLGQVPPEFAWRVPLATWFRFRAACDRMRVSLLLLTQHPCARSSAELVVRLQPGQMNFEGNVVTGVQYRPVLQRSRAGESSSRVVPFRKPPQSVYPGQWSTRAAWAQGGK